MMDAHGGSISGVDADELSFDEPEAAPPKPARKKIARGTRKPPTVAKADVPAPAAPAPASAKAAAPAPAAEILAPPQAPAAEIPQPVPQRRDRMTVIALGLAIFSSVIAVTGTLVASRTIARATIAIDAAAEHKAAPADAGTAELAAEVRALIARQNHAPAMAPGGLPAANAASPDIANAIDSLRVDLARQRPPLDAAGLAGLRDGQTAIAERLTRIEARLSSSPPAARAAGPRRPF